MTGYTPVDHALLNGEAATFIGADPDAFWIQVTDARANANPLLLEAVSSHVETLDAAGEIDDAGASMELREVGLNWRKFLSEPMLLTSPDLDQNPDDDIAVWSSYAGAFVADDQPGDRTRRATIDGWVRVVYEADGESFSKRVPVGARGQPVAEPGQVRKGPQKLPIRVRVHLEPYLDEGVNALAIAPGAQFVGLRAENGALVPHVYQVDPNDPTVGADDGMFTFIDLIGNERHDAGEPSERYLDLSRGVKVIVDEDDPLDSFYLRGDQGANATDLEANGWGPVVTNEHVFDQIERANIAWAQAGIRVEMIAGPIIEAAPVDAAGEGILQDGWFRFLPFQWGGAIDGDLHTTINAINAAAAPNTLEVIFTGPVLFAIEPPDFEKDVAFGWTSPPSNHDDLAPHLQDNTYVLIAPNLELNLRTLAHEIGHALTNQPDADPVPYIFFPFEADPPQVPLIGDADPKDYRRLRHATEAAARRVRQQLNEIGNVLLEPVEEDDEP